MTSIKTVEISVVKDTDELLMQVYCERIKLYFDALGVSIIVVLINSFLLTFLLWTPESGTLLLSWCMAALAVAAYRCFTLWRYRRQTDAQRHASSRFWYFQMMFSVVLAGIAWGAAGYLFYDQQDTFRQSLLAFVLAGMCAGSIVSLSGFVEAVAVFLSLSLLPYVLRLAVQGTAEADAMALMVVLYLLMIVGLARRINSTIVSGFQMTYLRSRAEEKIQQQALFDELTGLPNRRLLVDRLEQALARVHRHGHQAALMFLDLDYFKRVNDTLGHAIGDKLLVEVASRMKSMLRSEDTAARLGGDEFVALLTEVHGSKDQVQSIVNRRADVLRRAIEAPVVVDGNELYVTVSIGVRMLSENTSDVDEMFKHADLAMYRAKDDGRNVVRFFAADMQRTLERRMVLEQKLRLAMENGEELELYLQPQYDRLRQMCGAELLIRWCSDGKFIPPNVFIPVAEESGLIYPLGDWVIDRSCEIAKELVDKLDGRAFTLSFNVSPRQFRHKGFAKKVQRAISESGVPDGLMEIEITENLMVEDIEETISIMQELTAAGVRFAIDDFGMGYSSLRYLKSLPLHTIKIDQSFIRDVLTDPSDASIVRAILSMSHALDLDIIAEGVEHEEVHDFLVEEGCIMFQGYLYSRPVPLEDFHRLLKNENLSRAVGL